MARTGSPFSTKAMPRFAWTWASGLISIALSKSAMAASRLPWVRWKYPLLLWALARSRLSRSLGPSMILVQATSRAAGRVPVDNHRRRLQALPPPPRDQAGAPVQRSVRDRHDEGRRWEIAAAALSAYRRAP